MSDPNINHPEYPHIQEETAKEKEWDERVLTGEPLTDPFDPKNKKGTPPIDEPNIVLSLIFFVIPIVGLLYCFLKRKEKPKACKIYLIIILVSIVINILYRVLF